MCKINPAYIETVIKHANCCPYFKLLSMIIQNLTPGHALLEMRLCDAHIQAFGVVHGGALASLIDTAAFWAAVCDLDEEDGITSVDLKLNYLAPVKTGTLTARGHLVKLGTTIGVGEAEVVDEKGKLIAYGTSTLMVLPGRGFMDGVTLPPKFMER
jgi:uncharacterized protein (TIGR00369 family)